MCPRDGAGQYSRPVDDYVAGIVISEDSVNTEMDQIATALTDSLAKDGQTTPTADLPMGGFKHTGVDDASKRDQYLAAGQLQDGGIIWAAGAGTADAITANYTPAITALVDGMLLGVRATAANTTTTPTFAPNGLTANTITQAGGFAVAAGSISGSGHDLLLRYRSSDTSWELLNPAIVDGSDITGVDAATLDSLDSTQLLRSDQDDTMSGALTVTGKVTAGNGSSAIDLKPGSLDAVWLSFYADSQALTTRSGYVGFGSAGNALLQINNDISGGDIQLTTNSGSVKIDGNTAWNAGNVSSAPGLDSSATASGYIDLPGGFILQWGGSSHSGNSSGNESFAITFPNACLQAVSAGSGNNNNMYSVNINSFTTSTINIVNSGSTTQTSRWMAIGY